jgi:ADP-heptose:LPS heptosyltransferase
MKKGKNTVQRVSRKSRKLTIPDCKHFTGYKPCFPGTVCLDECVNPDPRGARILLINLDAMGNILVTTSLLPAIKRKYPKSHITWITEKNTYRLLENNPLLDTVFVWEPESWMVLRSMKFDVLMNIDKSKRAGAFAMQIDAKKKFGYGINADGIIIPLNKEAEYNYRLGLDDHLKFHGNQKSVSQLLTEAMGLKYRRDEYILNLTKEELDFCEKYKRDAGLLEPSTSDLKPPLVVGFNTGCSTLYPNKKLTIDQHVVLIQMLSKREGIKLVLLGGREDTERNAEIARQVGDKVVSTPTTEGVRRGVCYENICDVVITGDSFGMHVAIGLKKFVIAWFGVSSWTEIDLFDRGVKLIPEGLACSPCWKKECPYNLECIQMVDLDAIVRHVVEHAEQRQYMGRM